MVKIFSHRGFIEEDIKENSIKSLHNAIKHGFKAIEFDIWFVHNSLVLNHDEPKIEELKDLPAFKDYLFYGNDLDYWLDFKNADLANIKQILACVKKDCEALKIDLDKLYFAPFIEDYAVAQEIVREVRHVFGIKAKIAAVCTQESNLDDLHKMMRHNHIHYCSVFYGVIDKEFMTIFKDIEIFAWTVNDMTILHHLEELGINNFISDTITPKIYDEKA